MSNKVYIVDDDDAVRAALCLLLRSVGLASQAYASAQAFLDHIQPAAPGERRCLITDVRMPGMSGLELQEEMLRRRLDIPTIVLSGHADVPMAVRAMRMGAISFLQKPFNEQEFIDLINHALNGSNPPASAKSTEEHHTMRAQLTPRQAEIFDLLMRGLQTKEVAHQLHLSPRTIEVHRAHILERLGAQSFNQLIRDLLQQKLSN